MHRQAMLVSLSLSPASAAVVTHNKHWAFLEEIDAPRWVDLNVEAALVGTVGDDPWFYRSHPHHEVPLKELKGVQPANRKVDCSTNSRLQIERKKSGICKTQHALQTFDGFPESVASESMADRRVVVKVASHGQLWARNQVKCAQPQSFEQDHDMDVTRLSMEEACGLESESLTNEEDAKDAKELPPLSLDISPAFCKSADQLLQLKEISSFSTPAVKGAVKSVVSRLERQQPELPRLNDARRLRKSLGSAMRVKLDDGLSSSGAAGCGAVPLPKSGPTGGNGGFGTTAVAKAIRLGLGTVVDVNKAKTRELDCVETKSNLELCGLGPDLVLNTDKISSGAVLPVEEPEIMGSETNHSSLKQRCSMDGNSGTRDNLKSSCCDGGAISGRLDVNSSVHAFDDIQRMRKSWGSALRVKISEDLEDLASEVGSNVESGTIKIKSRDVIWASLCPLSEESSSGHSPVETKKEKNVMLDLQGASQDEVVHMKVEGARVPKGLLAGACTHASAVKSIIASCEGQPSKRIREKPSANRFPSTPSIVVSANPRRSMSLGYLEKGTNNKMKNSNRSGSVQQNHPVRASSVCQPAEILKGVHSSKVGKENSAVQSPLKPSVNTGLVLERKTRQSVTRMSMPSFAAGAVSRQAVGGGLANKSNTILERRGEVQVPVSSQADSRKNCVSSQRKNVGHHKSPSKRMAVMDAPSRTQQSNGPSAIRASMPTFSSAILRQISKSVHNAGASSLHDGKKSSKHGDDNDIASLIAEHNRKFRPIPKYEPRLHSVKTIREWERTTGRLYYDLQPAEREKANEEISALKHMQ